MANLAIKKYKNRIKNSVGALNSRMENTEESMNLKIKQQKSPDMNNRVIEIEKIK